jgi:hypothetical protein
MRLAGHVAYLGENRNAYNILARKPGEIRPCVRDRYTWNDDIKIDLKELEVLQLDSSGPV